MSITAFRRSQIMLSNSLLLSNRMVSPDMTGFTAGFSRSMFFLSTKAGYVSGELKAETKVVVSGSCRSQYILPHSTKPLRLFYFRLADEIRENLLAQGLISQQDLGSGSNCIHPACIKDSLKQSLHNMHIDKVRALYMSYYRLSPCSGLIGFPKFNQFSHVPDRPAVSSQRS